MRTSADQFIGSAGRPPPASQVGEPSLTWDDVPDPENYLLNMPAADDARRAAFGRFVRRALEVARARGLTVPEIERATGVSKSTFYRWRDGTWTRDPEGSQVLDFCKGLEIPVKPVHDLLGWNEDTPRETTPPDPLDPDMERLVRKLRDPNVPDEEKRFIRESLRMLAARTVRKSG